MLLALLESSEASGLDLFDRATCDRLRQSAKERLDRTSPGKEQVRVLVWARGGRRILEKAKQLAIEHGAGLAGPLQLWHGLLEDPGVKALRVLAEAAVNVETLKGKLVELAERESYMDSKTGGTVKEG